MSMSTRQASERRSFRSRTWLRTLLTVIITCGACAVAPVVASTVASTPAAAETLTPLVTGAQGLDQPQSICYDSSGNLFIADESGTVYVDPATTGTVFGQSVTAGVLTAVVSGDGGLGPIACSGGNLFFSSFEEGFYSVAMLSETGGTFYGTSVPADAQTGILTVNYPHAITSMALDAAGNLYLTDNSAGTVSVFPAASGTVFGHTVTVGSETVVASGLSSPDGMAFNAAGDMFIGDWAAETLSVVPAASGTLFGHTVVANTLSTLESGLSIPQYDPDSVAVDANGIVLVADSTGVSALSESTGTPYDSPVTADILTQLQVTLDPEGITIGPSDNLVMADSSDNAVVEATAPTADVTGVSFAGPDTNPTVTITGTNFGSEPGAGLQSSPGCSASGTNFSYGDLVMFDNSQSWQAGYGGDCIGFDVDTWSPTQITFTFGSWYTDQEVSTSTELQQGDSYTVIVGGSYFSGTAPLTPSVTALSPTTGPLTGGTTVAITGTNFAGTTQVTFGSTPATSFHVNSDTSITAVDPAHAVGQAAVSVTTWYQSASTSADEFTYTPAVSASYACTLPAPLGTVDFPVVLTAVPAPVSSITEGGTFSTALAAQVTEPASVVDHYLGQGATSETVGAQSVTVDGDTSSGSPSGAVTPNTETASATNLPQNDGDFTSSTPYTFDTAYNPISWQTGPGAGLVDFVPGTIVITTSYVIHGATTSVQFNCAAPHNIAVLDSTTVDPPTSAASFQVPSTTPPLQNQVSAGTDGGWAVTIANTSETTVTGVSAVVSASDGGPALTYDTAAMAASGTTCSHDGAGKLSCSVGNLASGSSATLNLLVDTTGLAQGTTITGSAAVSSTNASSHTSFLGPIGVIVLQSGNGTKAVAAPGIALTSTKRTLKLAKATVTLTLPTVKIRVTKKVAGRAAADALAVSEAGTTLQTPPPVAVTLESLAPSAEPALCPPTGTKKCEGDIVQAVGNFSAYTNKKAPVAAEVKFFYGLHVPVGTIYMLKPNGKTVVQLSACTKTAGAYDTPCLGVPQKTYGEAAHDSLYVQATVYFTGSDPAMGRR